MYFISSIQYILVFLPPVISVVTIIITVLIIIINVRFLIHSWHRQMVAKDDLNTVTAYQLRRMVIRTSQYPLS